MQVQKNSRQIPSIERYTADKKYNDLLYGILQEISYREENVRYVDKKDINYSTLSSRVGLTRQTVSTKFKNLIKIGLVEYIEAESRYKLNYLDRSLCSLVPYDTLRAINNALSQNAISVFVYLLKRFIANNEKPYIVTMTQMKKFVGIATTTSSNNVIIGDILHILSLIGLLDYRIVNVNRDKTNIIVNCVRNHITKFC